MSIDKIRYGLIQLHQGVKDTFTQLSIYTLVDAVHIALHRGLVLGLPNPGRKGYEAIVIAHIHERLVQLWRPSVRLYDGRFQVVWDNHMGDASKSLYAQPERMGEVFHLLCGNRNGKGEAAVRHGAYKHLYVDHFSSLRIDV